ncbi:GlcNAc transferase [Tieghemostelium lacteum]|uniref:GlcNAc transferase n=1 Tax=Tieghemostelium lacteum TaxID=361077 RepID=A0A151Z4L1_TIELA|nr:GlcNAc transferase [Tieghemostelium lacteum]|eukprot:KYQ88857.1 GlcNAc transferase [Tieghemostelium lacteum]
MVLKLNFKLLSYVVGILLLMVTIVQLNYLYKKNYSTPRSDKFDGGEDLYSNIKKYSEKNQTIFISVASYRDAFCSDTLSYIFENADHPENIYVGLVDQGSEVLSSIPDNKDTEDFKFPNSYCYRELRVDPAIIQSNVRRIALTIEESKGPTYARYLATTLYRNESYFMQIDSHTRFMDGWDTALINDYWLTRSQSNVGANGMPRAVLTYYPRAFNASLPGLPDDDQSQVPRICQGVFNEKGIMTLRSFILKASVIPKECPFIAAGFFFTSGEALELVPFDPHLPNLFEGEEILYTARMYEKGFRFFGPTLNAVFHFYTRSGSPKFWEDNKEYYKSMMQSLEKVKYILGWNDGITPDMTNEIYLEFDKYTIHNRTALDEYYTRYGISYQNRTHDYDKWCK